MFVLCAAGAERGGTDGARPWQERGPMECADKWRNPHSCHVTAIVPHPLPKGNSWPSRYSRTTYEAEILPASGA